MPATSPPSRLWKTDTSGAWRFDASSDPQADYIASLAHELLFSGHWGNGKTIAICVKVVLLGLKYPGIQIVLLRRRYFDLRTSTLVHFRTVVGESIYAAGTVGGEKPVRFDFGNGSAVHFIGISGDNAQTDRLLSTEWGAIAIDECNELTESEWEMAMGRLRQLVLPDGSILPVRQIFGACNPDGPHHWLYGRFRPWMGSNKQHRDGALERECIVAGLRDNEAFQPEDYLRFKLSLTGVRAQRYRDGKWVAYEGSVYDMWDPATHVVAKPAAWAEWRGWPPPDWERIVGIDLGYINPFVAVWLARDPDGKLYLYRQWMMSRRTVDDHARKLLELEAAELADLRAAALEREPLAAGKWDETEFRDYLDVLNVRLRASDHDAGDRAILDRELHAGGARTTVPADKDRDAGRQTMFRLLAPEQPGGPRLVAVRDSLVEVDQRLRFEKLPASFEEEIVLAIWEKPPASGARAGAWKDVEVDRDNHALDAVRYAVQTAASVRRIAVY